MRKTTFISAILILLSFSSAPNTPVASVKFKIGDVFVIRSGETEKKPVFYDTKFYAGDMLETVQESRAELRASDNTVLRIGESSLFKVRDLTKKDSETRSKFQLFFGKLYVKVKRLFGPTDEHSIKLPTAVAAVRGTEFFVEADSSNSRIFVREGTVDVGNVDMLTSFDSFIDYIQKDAELFEKWKQKNNGESFYLNDYKAFKAFQQAEMDAYAAFAAGEKAPPKDSLWIKSVKASQTIVIEGASRRVRPANAEDSLLVAYFKL